MKSRKFFTVTNPELIKELKECEVDCFVYPLTFFCVGIPVTFDIEDIKEDNAYIFVNRILDSKSMDKLKETLKNLPSNIKGIIFDDLGLIEVLKDSHLEKVLYNSHFCTNYESINYMFDYVDEVIVSTDITEEEIDTIIAKSNKKISVLAFGLVPSLYSRRHLLSNYAKHYGKDIELEKELTCGDKRFIALENEHGMMMYHYPYYNASRLIKKDISIKWYHPIFLSDEEVINVAKDNLTDITSDSGFLDMKTIYKVKER